MDVDTLFRIYKTPYELAEKLVKVLPGRDRLRPAAERWVRTFAAPESRSPLGPLDAGAVHSVLSSLNGGTERFARWLAKTRIETTVRGTARVSHCEQLLEAVIAVAAIRDRPFTEWREPLSALVVQRGVYADLTSWSDTLVVSMHDDPEAAYLLATAAVRATQARGARYPGDRHAIDDRLARRPLRRLALARQLEGDPPTDQDAELLALIEADDVLDDTWCFGFALELLSAGKGLPGSAQTALEVCRRPLTDGDLKAQPILGAPPLDGERERSERIQWFRSLRLLATTPAGIAEVPTLVADMVARASDPSAACMLLRDNCQELFFGKAWKDRPEALVPIVAAMFARNAWSAPFWNATLAPWGFSRHWDRLREHEQQSEIVANLVRKVLGAYLLVTAESEKEPVPRRKAAIAALGQLGLGSEIGPRLGALARDAVVGSAAKDARKRMSRSSKGQSLPADVGIETALATFTWAGD